MLKADLFMTLPSTRSYAPWCAVAFTPKRIEAVRQASEEIAND